MLLKVNFVGVEITGVKLKDLDSSQINLCGELRGGGIVLEGGGLTCWLRDRG